ncbi:MAG TPA: hypothetical protein VG325_06375 [Solirubrobacteraceae bacterium]|nr:hypothetical protein [Solirubrobacteraceae bacterium]
MTPYEQPAMSANSAPSRFTVLPDDETLAETVAGLKAHGLSVEVVDDLDAARRVVLARIPEGSSVMSYLSVTLEQTGIARDQGRRVISRLQPDDLQMHTKGARPHGNR